MKYISLFSGIGGFEVAIHKVFPEAKCLGYSEIKNTAIKVYEEHFPDHRNLGDITQITDDDIQELVKDGCDLIVGGFPCTNLSSLASISGNDSGLEGPKSGLFYELIRFLSIAKPKHIIIENNYSMSKVNRKIITSALNNVMDTDIYMTMLDSSLFGVQTRKRLYWTNFIISGETQCTQTWTDVLEPLENIWKYRISEKIIMYNNTFFPRKTNAREQIQMVSVGNKKWKYELGEKTNYRTRWDLGMTSDTTNQQELNRVYPIGKSRTIITTSGNNNIIVDRRTGHKSFTVRHFSPIERERLFNFPNDWTKCLKYKTTRGEVLGNSVVINVIIYILDSLP